MVMSEADNANISQGLTPRQVRTLNNLISIGAERPFSKVGLSEELGSLIQSGTESSIKKWTEKGLYFTKSQYMSMLKCEGAVKAYALSTPDSKMPIQVIVGVVAHRAVQLTYTHPGKDMAEYIKQSIKGARSADKKIDEWFATASQSDQSDVIMQSTSKVTNFSDDWPRLEEAWSPRFEEPISSKFGNLTLSCRADLILGRPRADLRQTMMLIDLKSGNLKPEHEEEASFYALVSTLRHGVPPWRSLIYSLASGEYSQPDVSEEMLFNTAKSVIETVNNYVEIMTEEREPLLLPSEQCRYCPISESCSESTIKEK
jgi:hypothetical protein